jgi:hypothetical protein
MSNFILPGSLLIAVFLGAAGAKPKKVGISFSVLGLAFLLLLVASDKKSGEAFLFLLPFFPLPMLFGFAVGFGGALFGRAVFASKTSVTASGIGNRIANRTLGFRMVGRDPGLHNKKARIVAEDGIEIGSAIAIEARGKNSFYLRKARQGEKSNQAYAIYRIEQDFDSEQIKFVEQ